MTNNEDLVKLAEKLERRAELLRQLPQTAPGKALLEVLQEEHDVILTRLMATPANEVHKVADCQGRYHIINLLLNQILEDDNADEAS